MARPKRSSPLAVVRAAYHLDLDEEDWLAELVERSSPLLGDGFAAAAYTFDARDSHQVRPLRVSFGRATTEETIAGFHGWHAECRYARLIYNAPAPCQTMSGYMGPYFAQDPAVAKYLHPVGAHDVIYVIARNPAGDGVALTATLGRTTRLDSRRAAQWARVAAHLASGRRLRQRLHALDRGGSRRASAALDGADGIFSPRGRLEYEGSHLDGATRARMRESVRRILDARALEQDSPEEALAHWRALEFGRWCIVDTFDTDGKRYVVARRNDPAVDRVARLSARERQIAAFASLGHSLKLIAYEVGLSTATVSYHLTRAQAKLGVRSRAELVSAWNRRPREGASSEPPSKPMAVEPPP
jgi:DNA-binding CsgD family transcriptional regulator